jgi:hypothetical protein
MAPRSRTDDDIRGLEAHQVAAVPAAVQLGRETVRMAEAGPVQLVADAAGLAQWGWPIWRVRYSLKAVSASAER